MKDAPPILEGQIAIFHIFPSKSYIESEKNVFMIFAKTNLVSHIKCGTNETRMEKRTIWCIICICPINSKHFEFVWVALLKRDGFWILILERSSSQIQTESSQGTQYGLKELLL